MKVGILGAGQLGQMMALAGVKLDFSFRFFDPSPEAPAARIAECIHEDYHDFEALAAFAEGLDLVTYEFENVPADSVRFIAERVPVYPSAAALEVAQERIVEKDFFARLGIPTPPYAGAESLEELNRAAERVGLPAVVKTCRYGYDGKGQHVLRSSSDIAAAWESIGGTPLIVEGFVDFDRELSILAVRSRNGETGFYPLIENTHREGILHLSIAPAPGCLESLQKQAEDYASRVLDALNYVGVLAIEFFDKNGSLIANEMAPRVHNSGHWTIEGARTSQFENHLRAVAGLALGSTQAEGVSAMINIIGVEPEASAVDSLPGAFLHLYGKAPRPRRKLGHITVCRRDHDELFEDLNHLVSVIQPAC